ncbi:MAG: EAL domain-containing protein [Clostridiales bacterium]|jgi:diguanylate cyclase (GGDEF)-like protein|nr:EAL domain-containing protein [Clostridiales bacterium]
MSIKKSLRTILIISSIIPVVFVSVIAQSLLSHRLLEVQKENLIKATELNRSSLETMIEIHKTEIDMLTYDNNILELLNENSSYDSTLINTVNQIFNDRKNVNPYCRVLTLYNKDRFAIAGSDMKNIENKGKFNFTLSYIYATRNSAVGVSGILGDSIEIGFPILDTDNNNPPLGYIISTLNLAYFDNYLDAVTFGDTGYAILMDHNGDILYHPDKSLIGSKITSTKLNSIVEEYNKGRVQASGSFELFYKGTNQVYGYSVIPGLDWALFVKQDISEIWSMTSLILTLLIFICAIILIVIIIFAHSLSKRYTEPIIELRDAMRTASDGDLAVQSNIKSKNELGELSKNFNKMLHIIKTNYEDLESMHEELLSNEEQLRNNYDHIEYLAYHDTLTNLPNKLAFLDYVNAALISSPGSNKSHAVYFVDLDNFKTVNDTLGHEYGDSLLIHTAKILTALGENGMLARAGGDEFLIFRENIESRDEAINYASSIIERFKDPIELKGEFIYLSMSIGIALYPDNGLSPNALIKNADIAMYKSKDTGKNKYTLFDSKMEDELNRNTNIVDILRGAIENNDIYLQYQPQYDLATKSIIGFEALMRIRSDYMGFITPEEFIPVAEESGLIIELSAWLIREACMFSKKLIDHGISPRYVSVNISSVQINRPGFIDFLSDILDETGLPPEYLVLEITESTLVSSIMDATKLLQNLQSLGVKISLDDFGTGYSSLNYLTKMPINTLKIDKSFIDNICTSKKDARIAETIISLAHSLKIQVVAEGVETEEQLELLKEKKCDIVQGFVFSHPLHPGELEDLIKHK